MSELFEGYVGIRLWDGQVMNDLLFTLILASLCLFALVYRFNHRAFLKMFKDIAATKERQSLFEKNVTTEAYFRSFMIFQTLSLCSLFAFSYFNRRGFLTFELSDRNVLLSIGGIFLVVLFFYLFKRFLYGLTGMVFSDSAKYKIWKNSYVAIMGVWGIFLYVPVIWSALWNLYPVVPIVLFVISYILCRFVIIYKTLRIFHSRNSGLLYISLYLCAQEILPLVFLYEGMVYLYNFIKISTLWH